MSEVAKLRAELAEVTRTREERAAKAAEAEEVAALSRDLADQRALLAAEEQHGALGKSLRAVHTDMGVVILKRPHAAIFKRFQDAGSTKSVDLEKLVRPCVVHPELTKFDQILEELPGTLVLYANAIVELVGTRAKDIEGK